jgi:hypothetical protein
MSATRGRGGLLDEAERALRSDIAARAIMTGSRHRSTGEAMRLGLSRAAPFARQEQLSTHFEDSCKGLSGALASKLSV